MLNFDFLARKARSKVLHITCPYKCKRCIRKHSFRRYLTIFVKYKKFNNALDSNNFIVKMKFLFVVALVYNYSLS